MSATVTASAMKAAAVESADCAVRSAMEAACGSAVSDVAMSSVASCDVASSSEAASVVAGAPVESAAAEVWSATVESVIPRASSDEDAIGEPAWAVVSVGRARVGSVIIVAVGACGRSADISRAAVADANADPDLRLGLDQRKRHQHTEQKKIFDITHCKFPLFPDGRSRLKRSFEA